MVLFSPWLTRCIDRRIPFMTTLSPGATSPVRSSVASTSSVCGCSPPRRPSGDSWIRSFCEFTNFERFGTRSSFLKVHPSVAQPSGSLNLPYPCSRIVIWPPGHRKKASTILGRTSVVFRRIPSTLMNLLIWSDRICRMATFLGRLVNLTLMSRVPFPSFPLISWWARTDDRTSSITLPGLSRSSSAILIPVFPKLSSSR